MIGKTVKQWLKAWWLLLVPIAFASGAVLAYAMTFRQLPANEDPGAWGTFGDFLGGLLNPLVSTLTLFVAASVWKLQREELELTRNELTQTKLAMEEQAKTAEQQRQEQRFFDLLNVYQQTLESITHIEKRQSGHQETHRFGKQAIAAWINESKVDQPAPNPLSVSDSEFEKLGYAGFTRDSWGDFDDSGMFDHYIRVIIHILTEAEALLGDQHIRYIELFRAQLSSSELILLGSNLRLQDAQDTNLTHLAVKYSLLKHLPNGDLRTELEQELPALAFGPSWAAEHTRQTSSTAAKEATA